MTYQQERPAKDKILALIEERGPMTAMQIGEIMGTGHRCARAHLTTMKAQGEVFTVEGSSPIQFSLAPQKTLALQEIDNFMLPVVRACIPFGEWKIDHAVHPRSVFELGAV